MSLDVVQHVAAEIEIARHTQAGQIARHIALSAKQHALPVLQG
jgi:hypothetical protein